MLSRKSKSGSTNNGEVDCGIFYCQEFKRLSKHISEFVQKPTLMPWGNSSILFKDPDGNLVNFFTPVTAEVIQRAKG
jgi:hypothetical protein